MSVGTKVRVHFGIHPMRIWLVALVHITLFLLVFLQCSNGLPEEEEGAAPDPPEDDGGGDDDLAVTMRKKGLLTSILKLLVGDIGDDDDDEPGDESPKFVLPRPYQFAYKKKKHNHHKKHKHHSQVTTDSPAPSAATPVPKEGEDDQPEIEIEIQSDPDWGKRGRVYQVRRMAMPERETPNYRVKEYELLEYNEYNQPLHSRRIFVKRFKGGPSRRRSTRTKKVVLNVGDPEVGSGDEMERYRSMEVVSKRRGSQGRMRGQRRKPASGGKEKSKSGPTRVLKDAETGDTVLLYGHRHEDHHGRAAGGRRMVVEGGDYYDDDGDYPAYDEYYLDGEPEEDGDIVVVSPKKNGNDTKGSSNSPQQLTTALPSPAGTARQGVAPTIAPVAAATPAPAAA